MKVVCLYTGNAQGRESATGKMMIYTHHIAKLAGPGLVVYPPDTWKANARRRLEILREMDCQHLFLGGYSHGQVVCMKIAKLAPQYGIKTVRIVLCDPIGRNPMLPRWGWAQLLSARSLTPWMKIRVPETVCRVAWVRQEINRPRAHDLKWNPETTHVADPVTIHANHSAIQWHQEWIDLVMREIDNWINPPKAIPIVLP